MGQDRPVKENVQDIGSPFKEKKSESTRWNFG